MKRTVKSLVSLLLVAFMLLTSFPLQGFTAIELPRWLTVNADAKEAPFIEELSGNLPDSADEVNELREKIKEDIEKIREDIELTMPDPLELFAEASDDEEQLQMNMQLFMSEGNNSAASFDWEYDEETKTLTVSGQGAMPDYPEPVGSDENDMPIVDTPWFSYADEIERVVVEEGITSIGDFAFCGLAKLTQVALPEGVTSIGMGSFLYCMALTSISIPDSVEEIGAYTFGFDIMLKEIDLPSSLTSIGVSVFYYCFSLENVEFPEGLRTIGDAAFYLCLSLKEIILPTTVTSIGETAFEDCMAVENLVIPDSVVNIGSGAFGGLFELESLTLPTGISSDTAAFDELMSLKELVIPETYTAQYSDAVNLIFEEMPPMALEQITNYSQELSCVWDYEAFDDIKYAQAYVYLMKNYCYDSLWEDLGEILTMVGKENNYLSDTVGYLNSTLGIKLDASDYEYTYDLLENDVLMNIFGMHLSNSDINPYLNISCYEASAQHEVCKENYINHTIIGEEGKCFCWPFSGELYSEITWEIDPDTKTLTFFGSGDFEYGYYRDICFLSVYDDYVDHIVFDETSEFTCLGSQALCRLNVEDITIPASVTEISELAFLGGSVKAIYVDSENPVYYSVDGVLYAVLTDEENGINANVLWAYPNGKEVTEFVVPEGIYGIYPYAFINSELNKVTINSDSFVVMPECFYMSSVKEVIIAGKDTLLMVQDEDALEYFCGKFYCYADSTAYNNAVEYGLYDYVEVIEEKEIASIEVIAEKTEYQQLEAYDYSDISVRVSFTDGTSAVREIGFTVSGYNSKLSGEQELTVEYCGFTATYTVTMTELDFSISVGETKSIDVNEREIVYIRFSPEVSGSYRFYSSRSDGSYNNTYGYLYDNNFNLIVSDDSSGNNGNFSISYEFEAGKTYYFGAKYNSKYNSGTFNVTLECDHDGEWEIITEATCTEYGSKTCVCVQCGETVTSDIPSLGHKSELTETIPATCTQQGSERYDCIRCDYYSTVSTSIAHTNEDGDYICDICGKAIIYEISKDESILIDILYTEKTTIRFTPEQSGKYKLYAYRDDTSYYSTNCYLYKENGSYIKEYDGSNNGLFYLSCYMTEGTTYIYEIRSGSTSNSGTFYVKLVCDHNWSSWTVTKEPSCTQKGEKVRSCTQCGEEVTAVLNGAHTDVDDNGFCDLCGGNASDIFAGETKLIDVAKGSVTYLKFVPEYSGEYTFYSSADADTYGYLYDGNKNQLTYNDDGRGNGNFSITYTLQKGKVYYWGAKYYSSSKSGSFEVTLDFECTHPDSDRDGICDFCGESSIVATGTCGNNLTWTIYGNTLVISGEGDMYNYYSYNSSPWYSYRDYIYAVEIDEGVTSIGSGAFYCCYDLEKITILNPDCVIYNSSSTIDEGATIVGHPVSTAQAYAENYGRTFEVIEHEFESIVTPPTCTQDGYTTHTCIDCGYSYKDSYVDAIGHEFESIVIPPTCTQDGYTTHTCNDCGYSYKDSYVEASGSHTDADLNGICDNCSESSIVATGTCGDNLTWTIYGDTLVITGEGDMDNYSYASSPWKSYRDYIYAVEISDGVTSIGSCAFSNCTSLTQITIPDSVTSIGSSAFYYCTSLTQITIPDSVTSIGSSAFNNCTALTEITISEGVTSIGSSAFYYCTSLTQITIPESVTSIGSQAFYNCTSLTEITIPDSVTSIGSFAFSYCVSLPEIVVDEANSNYSSLDGVLYNKDKTTLICYPAGKTDISFEIPEGVTSIGSSAFYYCTSLEEIVISEGVTSIGSSAFDHCTSLTQITIPDSVTSIGSYAFYICTSLTQITIPESVTSIGSRAFYCCYDLEKITILNPECVIFDASDTIDSGATIVGHPGSTAQAYAENYGRTFEVIEHNFESVVTNPTCTQDGYTTHTCIDCGYSYTDSYVDAAGSHTDADLNGICDNCSESSIVASGTCGDNLTWTIYVDTLFISGDGEMYNYSSSSSPWKRYRNSIDNVVIDDGVTYIGRYSFYDCTALTKITISESVTSIGDYAICYCTSLKQITIPESVISIGSYAFYGCTSLEKITILNPKCAIYDGSTTIYSNATIVGHPISTAKNYAESYYRTFEAIEHNFESVVTPPTCTRDGYTTHTCIDCGYSYKNSYVDATGHTDEELDGICDICAESSIVVTGTCGDNLTWTIYGNTLVITGEGEMDTDNNYYYQIPWYSYRGYIDTVIIDDGVTSIGKNAFYDCTSLAQVTIPEGVTSIGDNAFYNCKSLTQVTIPDSVTSIGESAFSGCTSLTQVTIPDSVTSIGESAFSGCTSLTQVTIPEGVTSISDYTFNSCKSLTQVTIPDSVTSIGNSAFYNCTSLTQVTIPDSVTSIGNYTFRGCSSLTQITIPDSVTSIGDYTFNSCKSLTQVTIPDSVTSIGSSAFEACTALTQITIPKGVTSIGDSVFSGCEALTEIIVEEDNPDFSSLDGVVYNKDKTTLICYPAGKTDTPFEIPDGVTSIGDYAFSGCVSLMKVIIPESIASIGSYAFYNCASLMEVTISDGVTSIGSYAFYYCTSLTEITIPDSVTIIGKGAFCSCTLLAQITLSDNVTSIGYSAFSNCTSLAEITIPKSVTSIGSSAFSYCTSLEKITILNPECEIYNSNGTIDSGATIVGHTRSTAQTYAQNYNRPFVSTPHEYESIITLPTCKKSGYTSHVCTLCQYTYIDTETTALGHDYSTEWTVDKAPTCAEDGSKSHHCSRCDDKADVTVVEKLGHDYSEWTVTVEPDCTNTGIEEHTCSRCDKVETQTVAALGHDYSTEWTVDKAPTCTEDGSKSHHCSRCDDKADVTVVEKLGHDYSSIVTLPTCTEDGYTTHTCNVCQYTYTDSVTDSLGHSYGDWIVDSAATCTKEGNKHRVCVECGNSEYESIERSAHTYESQVVPPTYLEQGYTLYTCSVCGDTYKDTYVDPLPRIDLSDATLELEYTSVYYEGLALTPDVNLTYEGETFDSSKELKITYTNNNRVGTATVTIEGINRFEGTAELQFEISYKVIPEQIVNVIAIGEIGKISLSWGESSEVNTDSYNIYRKADGETEYQLIKTINGRTVLSYEDKNVEKSKTYSYYVTGIGLYGAESEPSLIVTATVLVDEVAPTVLKVSPAAASVISGETTLSATATDNIGVTKIAYFYTLDNGENWVAIGETTNKAFSIVFDTSDLGSESVKVKAVAYDAEGNESDPVTVVYSLDNVGPEKVTGLSAVTLSSKITLSWNDVTANDAAYFILQTKSGEEWTTAVKNITTLGYTLSGLQPDTDYAYRVACVDTHGNIGEYSDEITVRTAVDETAPVITSQSPSSSRYNSTIKFSATAMDDCDVKDIEIQVSADLSSWTTISTNTYAERVYKQTYTYTIDLSSYAEGSIFVRAVATDFSGNISDTSDAAPYTEYIVDKTAPEAPTGISANGNDGYITVSWTMGSEADLDKYFVYKSTSLDGNYQLVASNLSTLNYHDRDVQSGREFYYKVKVSDTCGNMSEYSNAASATMSPDTQSPEITSISSTYQQKISNSSHTINVAANDNNKLSYIVVEYCTSINPEYTQLVVSENIDNHYKSISVTLPIDGLTDGDVIHLRAYAVDMAGLQSEYATAKYTLDTTPPMVDGFTASLDGTTVQLSWKDNRESDLSGFKVYRSVDGETFTLLGSRGVSSTGSYSFIDTITDKESNTYIYKLESIDRLGNTASQLKSVEYTYVYVNQAPIAQMSVPDFMTAGVEEIFDASASTDDIVIISYLWDFGDGTTSTEMKPVKSYDAVGTYTVKLSVTDNEGITSTITKDIEVKERDLLGTLNVKVVDENGKALSYVPVYFDLGSDNQKIIYTNASGVATLQMLSGTHTIGMYTAGYLPVKKDVVVLANATRTVTLTTVEEDIVTGNFEITRMTFDEIVAAGIDVYDPANQNVYSATVRVTYGSTPPLTVDYVRNDDEIISYTIKDENGKPVTNYTNGNGETRKIVGVTYIPSSRGDKDVVAIIDIPAEASYLKEFFDVRLHIINNASSDFVLEMNEVSLNVPDGMTLMTSVSGDYASSDTVIIDSIKGQETVTLAWVLRGDNAGEYNLSADFTGTLAEFNELVTARFETEEPIKVYGLEGVKFRILAADEIHNDTLYFNIELENERDIDIYMPSIGLTDKINNVTASVLHNNAEDDFFSEAYILNAYIQNENGQKQYLAVTYDANGRATTSVEVLTPGQKIVYEYVAYNAINYDGVAYFKNAAIAEFEGVISNIETGHFHKELYSFTDYSAKLDDILSLSDTDETTAFRYINNDYNYYYITEAKDNSDTVLNNLYKMASIVLEGDLSLLTQDEQRDLIQRIIITILSDESVAKLAEDHLMNKYTDAVVKMIDELKIGTINSYIDEGFSAEDIADVFADITKNSKKLAVTYREKGSEAFKNELSAMIFNSTLGIVIDAKSMLATGEEIDAFSNAWETESALLKAVFTAANESQREAMYFSFLKYQCNTEIAETILDAIIENTEVGLKEELAKAIAAQLLPYGASIMMLTEVGLGENMLIWQTAKQMKSMLNSERAEFYGSLGDALNYFEDGSVAIASLVLKAVMKKAIGSTPLALLSAGFSIIDSVFGWENYVKQQDAMRIYNSFNEVFSNAFFESAATRDYSNDFYSMTYLRALCEIRLSGERQYKKFITDYLNGVYLLPLSEENVLKQINRVMNTSYATIDEWYDNVQYNIVHSRDILFNTEAVSELETPRAPVVTLDYDNLQTVQVFTPEYEYCFADGIWKKCSNETISFNVGVTPSVLRVRKAASDTNLAGEITSARIYARKDLSKLITAKFDGVNYLLDNLSSKYNYQVIFTDDLDAAADWSAAQTISGSDSTVKISGVGEYSNIIIRSCQNHELYETTSNPSILTVAKKVPLNLVIDGSGTVTQTANSGCYFNGESIDLIAAANEGCSFIGWYIDGVCVSTDKHYIVEMSDGLEVTAQFTGAKIKGISIEELPAKLNYYEGEALDLNGIKVLVTYSDDTTAYADQFSAKLTSNTVGKSTVEITFGGYSASYEITINHNESQWITVSEPTLTEDGLKEKRCLICKNVISSEVIAKLGCEEHTATVKDAVDATCTTPGYTGDTVCEICGEIIEVGAVIEALSHDYSAVVTLPTCTEGGYTTNICSVCGDSYISDETDPVDHEGVTFTQPATCEVSGYSITTCIYCYEELDFEVLSKLGHDWDEGVVTTQATCISKGIILYTCKHNSSHTKTGEGKLNADNHTGGTYVKDAKSATCTADGYTGDTYCDGCKKLVATGNSIGKLGHSMGGWLVLKNATLLEEGQEKSACIRCGHTETRSIPRLEGTKTQDDKFGVSVEYTSDSYNEDIVVKVEEVYDGSQYFTQQYANIKTWNIKTYVGNTEVQPDEPVLVRIPLPADYTASAIAVYHINSETGRRERVQPVIIENGYICFMANSFSLYIIVDESSEIIEEPDIPTDPSEGCDHMCHKTGFMGFIWKIIRFFQKLFKVNPVCECGAAHY